VKHLLRKFLGILKLELEDLEDDIGDLLEVCQRRKDQREITDYVYLENKTLLLNEIAAIKSLIHSLDDLDTGRFATQEQMFQEVDRLIHARTRDSAFPEAVYSLVKRRLDKVKQYLLQQ
jgi:hypothetical protein